MLPPVWLDDRIELRDFSMADLPGVDHLGRLAPSASPARMLSDLFWMNVSWSSLTDALGPLRLLDVGCGKGYYGPRLIEWSGGEVESYVGIDAVPRPSWAKLEAGDARLRYVVGDASRLTVPNDVNLIISQSCLEHVEDDMVFFSRIRDQLVPRSTPWLQLHLVPAAACRSLYGPHGVRQYTLRTISRATRLYGGPARFVLFRLGGEKCIDAHRMYVTTRLREQSPARYRDAVRTAVESELQTRHGAALFYAFAIASGSEVVL